MTSRLPIRADSAFVFKLTTALLALGWCGGARGDDVTLISGTTFKQAIGGRVRGQVQKESPNEVVVSLGATTTSVPTDQIQSIRYDGQSANFQLAEARESSGQLVEAADLFKKAATESAGKPYPLQAALFREAEVLTELSVVEPARAKEAKDKLTRFLQTYPATRHLAGARACQVRLQLYAGDFAGAEAAIAELEKLPRGAERTAVLRTKVWARQGKYDEAIARPRQADQKLSQGLGASSASSPAGQGRKSRGEETIQGSGDTLAPRSSRRTRRKTRPPRPSLQHLGRLPPRGQSAQGRLVRLSPHRLAV